VLTKPLPSSGSLSPLFWLSALMSQYSLFLVCF
jgi:hypothetical protein